VPRGSLPNSLGDYDSLVAERDQLQRGFNAAVACAESYQARVAELEAALRDVIAYFDARNVHPMVQRLSRLLVIPETGVKDE